MPPSSCIDLAPAEQQLLLAIARSTIHAGLQGAVNTARDTPGLPPALQAERGAFVTLTRRARLRGCIGTIEPRGPLAQAVADCAYSAAFGDPRFPQLRLDELAATRIEISVLTPMEPLAATSREALISQLQPGVDGLVLEDGRHRSTFLPKVWDQLTEPHEFIDHLLAKAGLPRDHWSPSLRAHRYRAFAFNDS
jgi:AmmeMemoRadiSam system protein A